MSKFFASDSPDYLEIHDDFYIIEKDGLFQELELSSGKDSSDFSSTSLSDSDKPENYSISTPAKKSFFDVSDSESEGESSTRMIVSQKQKFVSELSTICESIKKHVKSADFYSAMTCIFALLFLVFEDAQKKCLKTTIYGFPAIFLKTVNELEIELNHFAVEERKKLEGTQFKAFTTLKQKVRKSLISYADYSSRLDNADGDFIIEKLVYDRNPLSTKETNLDSVDLDSVDSANFLPILADLLTASFDHKRSLSKDALDFSQKLLHKAQTKKEKIYSTLYFIQCSISTSLEFSYVQALSAFESLKSFAELLFSNRAECESNIAGLPDLLSCIDYVISFLNKIDSDINGYLSSIDIRSKDYIKYFEFEKTLFEFLLFLRKKFEPVLSPGQAAQILTKIFEHLHAKPYPYLYKTLDENTGLLVSAIKNAQSSYNPRMLCFLSFIYSTLGKLESAKDLLSEIFSKSSSLEDDISIHILYNRSLINYGVNCAMQGLFREAYRSFYGICLSGHSRELLAQELPSIKIHDRVQKLDKSSLFPPHLHFNLEMIESLFLLSGFFTEYPSYLAELKQNFKRNIKPLNFRLLTKILDCSEKPLLPSADAKLKEILKVITECLLEGHFSDLSINAESIFSRTSLSLYSNSPKLFSAIKRSLSDFCALSYALFSANYFDSASLESLKNYMSDCSFDVSQFLNFQLNQSHDSVLKDGFLKKDRSALESQENFLVDQFELLLY